MSRGSLLVHHMVDTIQGEGSLAGRPARFVRFAGCNYWSGEPRIREGIGECATWCDTEFRGGVRFDPERLADRIATEVGLSGHLVVITGGEPMLQLVKPAGVIFLSALNQHGMVVAIETNGSIRIPDGIRPLIDHVTVSPKPLRSGRRGDFSHVVQREGTDLKIVVPTTFSLDELFRELSFEHTFLQPRDDGDMGRGQLAHAIDLASRYPGVRVSVQIHKFLDMP